MNTPNVSPTPGRAVIVGFGLMGCDIGAIFLAGGWRVTAVEPEQSVWQTARARLDGSLVQLGASPERVAPLTLVVALGEVDFADVGIVIEAVPERLALKQAVFAELDGLVPEGVPVATNASGLRVTDIAKDCKTRQRMANLHFFLPAHLVPGVEVVRGEYTDPEICDRVAEIMAGLGRKVIRVSRDVPGFLANRIQHALMREVFAAIDSGLATAADVDTAVRYTFGFRYVAAGPIRQKEMSGGLGKVLAVGSTIYPSLSNMAGPTANLTKLAAENRLGMGFHEWPPEKAAREKARYERALLEAARLLQDEGDAD
jgi:3-hydroxybutyryl-CoA dehydrogenase